MDDYQTIITAERARLRERRQHLVAQLEHLDRQVEQIDRELLAIAAYERVKEGVLSLPAPTRRQNSGRAGKVYDLLRDVPGGLTREELLRRLTLRGDCRSEKSVVAALSALKRYGQVFQRQDRYIAIPSA